MFNENYFVLLKRVLIHDLTGALTNKPGVHYICMSDKLKQLYTQ